MRHREAKVLVQGHTAEVISMLATVWSRVCALTIVAQCHSPTSKISSFSLIFHIAFSMRKRKRYLLELAMSRCQNIFCGTRKERKGKSQGLECSVFALVVTTSREFRHLAQNGLCAGGCGDELVKAVYGSTRLRVATRLTRGNICKEFRTDT